MCWIMNPIPGSVGQNSSQVTIETSPLGFVVVSRPPTGQTKSPLPPLERGPRVATKAQSAHQRYTPLSLDGRWKEEVSEMSEVFKRPYLEDEAPSTSEKLLPLPFQNSGRTQNCFPPGANFCPESLSKKLLHPIEMSAGRRTKTPAGWPNTPPRPVWPILSQKHWGGSTGYTPLKTTALGLLLGVCQSLFNNLQS